MDSTKNIKAGDRVQGWKQLICADPMWHGKYGTILRVIDSYLVELRMDDEDLSHLKRFHIGNLRPAENPPVSEQATRFKVGDKVRHVDDENVPAKTVSEVAVRESDQIEFIRIDGWPSWLTASKFELAQQPEAPPALTPEPDAYELHREKLGARLIAEGHSADTNLDLAVASVMVTKDTCLHEDGFSNQMRLSLSLRDEQPQETSVPGLQHPLSTWSGRRGGRRLTRIAR